MKYRCVGKSGVEVSEIGLGGWQVGGPLRAYFEGLGWISHGWGDVDGDAAVRLIHTCGELGINFIDTAAGYGAGHSEEIVGRAIGGQRDAWVVETKGGESFTEEGTNLKDFSRERLLHQIEESLRRLGTDYVDVYLLHNPSETDVERGECLEALTQIKQSGKARLVGVSLGTNEMGLQLLSSGIVDVYQVVLSLMDATAADILPAAMEAGVGVVARCAFGSGFLAGNVDETTAFADNDRRSWQADDSKRSTAATARAFGFLEVPGRTLAQACLQYPLSFEGVSTVIPGSKSVAHMTENAAAPEAPPLSSDELARIAEV